MGCFLFGCGWFAMSFFFLVIYCRCGSRHFHCYAFSVFFVFLLYPPLSFSPSFFHLFLYFSNPFLSIYHTQVETYGNSQLVYLWKQSQLSSTRTTIITAIFKQIKHSYPTFYICTSFWSGVNLSYIVNQGGVTSKSTQSALALVSSLMTLSLGSLETRGHRIWCIHQMRPAADRELFFSTTRAEQRTWVPCRPLQETSCTSFSFSFSYWPFWEFRSLWKPCCCWDFCSADIPDTLFPMARCWIIPR